MMKADARFLNRLVPAVLLAVALPLVPPPSMAASRPMRATGGPTYRHPLGFNFAYPAGWQVEKGERQALQLVPADRDELELILLTTDSAQGISRLDDPRVVALVEADLRQLFPFLERVGEPEPVRTGLGPGVRLTWEGTSPTGVVVQAQVYLVLHGENAVGLVAVGARERVAARTPALRRIFASFSAAGSSRPAGATALREGDAPEAKGHSTARGMSRRTASTRRSSPGRGPSVAQAGHSPLAREWRQRLNGKRLTYLSSYSSGTSGGYNSRWDLYLNPNGSFVYQSSSSVSIYVPGATGSSSGQDASEGTWRILTRGGQAILEVNPTGKPQQQYLLAFLDGKTFLNRTRIFVTQP